MSNKLEERLIKAKEELSSRRGTGRTTKMIDSVIEEALKDGKRGDYFLVISHTPEWASDMMGMLVKRLHELKLFSRQKNGKAVEVKEGVSILFRTEHWWDQPRNKRAIKPAAVYYDNVLSDLSLEKHIRYLENELNPQPFREPSRIQKQAAEYTKAQLEWASGKRKL